MNPQDVETRFVDSLERVHQSALGAIHALYCFMAFKRRLENDDDNFAKVAIARNPNFWSATAYGWQVAYIVGLGRVFDIDSGALRLRDLIDHARDYRGMFSADRLRQRLRLTLPMIDGPQKEAMVQTYVHYAVGVTEGTFAPLYKALDERKRIYDERYAPLRHGYYAHLAATPKDALPSLYGQTTLEEFEMLLAFPLQLRAALRGLYVYGNQPLLMPLDSEDREVAARDFEAIITQQAKLDMG